MPRSERRVEYARNFTENLVRIGTFLEDEPRFRQLLESLEVRCERLGRLPGLGRLFVADQRPEAPLTVAVRSLELDFGAVELRELVVAGLRRIGGTRRHCLEKPPRALKPPARRISLVVRPSSEPVAIG